MKKSYTDSFFDVGSKYGFLPNNHPLTSLPNRYNSLQRLLDNMPVKLSDGSNGYLAIPNKIENEVERLPNYIDLVKKESEILIIQALYRAYCFLTSAYTLELSYQEFVKTKKYGKARQILPKQVAQPFVCVAEKLDVYPWLDYHYAYSLGNYRFLDKSKGFHWSNLDQCVKFSGTSDESGFIMNHVDINQHSPKLVESVLESLKAIKDDDQKKLNENLKQNFHSMVFVNDRRKDMWVASRWKHYNDFRIFIMGIKGNNEIFDDGLVYQGVWDEPKQYRGQTGAQDNIIPMEDIFSGVINFYPDNQLTKYLLDLRKYRPKCIQNFFVDLKQDIDSIHGGSIFNFLKSSQNSVGMCYLLAIVEEIYKFRNGHWQFVQKYIMSNTKYAKATGGTPIISWIPNQIKSVLNFIEVILHELQSMDKDFDNKQNEFFINSLNTYKSKKKLLDKQLIVVSDANYNPGKVFELNKKFKLEDSNFEKK